MTNNLDRVELSLVGRKRSERLFKFYGFLGILIAFLFLITILLLTPHIFWQIKNDFPSFVYHLDTRASGFNLNNLFEFIFGQIALAGPLSGIVVIYLTIKFRAKDTFEKTLKYIAIGFYLFFIFLNEVFVHL